jgi:tRNA (guanine-N7-)-methyltransferase
MNKPGLVEREFGVPIPGKILAPTQWTKTALKKLPPTGPLDLANLFGRTAPLIVDLGCGNGRFLLGSALARPECDHLGIDILPMVLRYATRRGNQRGLGNLRFAAVDAQRLLGQYLTSASVREIHCYHPQPYYDACDMQKRLLTPAFLERVREVLEPGGKFFVQTDNAGYWNYVTSVVSAFFEFHSHEGPWPDAPRGRTRREIIAMKRRYPIYRGWGVRKDACSVDVHTLPPPSFDAGPRHKDLDALERE